MLPPATLTDAAPLDEARRRIEQLERQLDDARAELAQLQQMHAAVVGSVSWRVTAPLRTVRRLFTPAAPRALLRRVARWFPAPMRNRWKVRLAASPVGATALRWLYPAPPAGASAAGTAPLDKEAVRARAEADLTAFLASGQRIDLARAAGPEPQVSVVVVVYNQAGLTLLCLRALAASRGVSFETLIVDNASSDRMPELLSRVDGARLLAPGENLGFLRAVNLAAGHARGRHLLLLNNDALVEPDTLALAVRRLEREPRAGAVGGPILLWDGRLQEAGSIVWRDGSCLGYGRGDDPAAPAYRFVRDVDYCSGAFLMVRRDWFERLGRFDEAFAPAYYEESDFCARLWEAGQAVVYDPQVRVRHFEFASDSGSGRAIELQTAHRALFVERHPGFLAARPAPDPACILFARHRLPAQARRVLVIDDRVPLPWLGQGYPRAASLVQALAEGGDFVTHYPLQFPNDSAEDVARALPDTVEVMLGCGLAGFAAFLDERDGYYDTVIVSRPHNMAVLRAVRARQPHLLRGARVVYDAEALFSLRDIAKAAVDGVPLSADDRARRIAEEMALADGAQAIVAVSALEALHYRDAGRGDVHVLGHAIEADPGPTGFDERSGFLFVGAMQADDTPNADSVVWFVNEVWPRIVRELGETVTLDIVGACDAPSVRALARPGVRVRGRVDDLAGALDAARVFVVPTRYAAGIPHKAHEAAARGLPMVVTPLIAEQLGWADRVPVGATATAFAGACVRLHEDAAHWRQVRDAVVDAVRRDCDPDAFRRSVRALLGRRPGADPS